MEDKNPRNDYGETPLHKAAFDGNVEIVELILENVIEKNPANIIGTTPLHNAASIGKFKTFKLIFDNSLNKNPIDVYGNTPLHKAADGGGSFKDCQLYSFERKCQHTKICQIILDNIDNKAP